MGASREQAGGDTQREISSRDGLHCRVFAVPSPMLELQSGLGVKAR